MRFSPPSFNEANIHQFQPEGCSGRARTLSSVTSKLGKTIIEFRRAQEFQPHRDPFLPPTASVPDSDGTKI
eukprot:1853164-Rhodomonas_salina.1